MAFEGGGTIRRTIDTRVCTHSGGLLKLLTDLFSFSLHSYPNGNVLEGEFDRGKIHGHAVFRYPNGDQREGFFRENVLDGQVIFTESTGKTIIEVWRNGKRVKEEEQVVVEADDNGSEKATERTTTSPTSSTSPRSRG